MKLHHSIVWDDQHGLEQTLDAHSAMQRLAAVLGAEFRVKPWRDEERYYLRRDDGELELSIVAGHVYDTREWLTFALEVRVADRLLMTYGCSQGIERIKASNDTVWLRTPLGVIIIIGNGAGGLVEIQD